MKTLPQVMAERVLVLDGAMGTMLQRYDLPLEDYLGLENCSEILNQTRPDVIRAIHEQYLEAGADAVETNSFGGTRLVLGEFGLADQTAALNRRAAELAREAADAWSTPERPRFVFGSMGPGTKLPSLGHVSWNVLHAAYEEQAAALLDGGVDALLVETAQDMLQVKCALSAIEAVQARRARRALVVAQVTMETTGTMLVGTSMAAALAVLDALPCDVVGLNCATGPDQMAGHVAYLGRHSRKPISVLPNAGLPELIDGVTRYPLSPDQLAEWHLRFVEEHGVSIIGGCCGTTPEHIAAVVAAVGLRAPRPRQVDWRPQLASLYGAVELRQELDVFAIGERTNANGSRRFRALLVDENWDGIVKMARRQAKTGSHAIDVCTALVGRDEVRDMTEVLSRLNTAVDAPLVVDSTQEDVLQAALKLIGGRPVINSIHLEEGEARVGRVCALARQHGAAVVALTIDEVGMARKAEDKLRIARRLYHLAVEQHGLRPEDLLFDPLTFTVATGQEADRRLALETLEGVRLISREFPDCGVLLGLSNVSFGLQPAARHALNSVFVHHAREAGLTAAIVHASALTPLFKLDPEVRRVAEDLIFDRRAPGYDPLQRFMGLFGDETAVQTRAADRPVEVRLKDRIVDGDREGLEGDLAEALTRYAPLQIINELLLDGMRVVGELFGAGEMQLPFVLQAAETMKAAVAFLEPHMDKADAADKASIVLATVRGDVHDIGKNLVDIILSNNGYRVYNLGIKQPIEAILKSVRETGADAVGMSGLLVKSTVVMRENLELMRGQGLDLPVVLGGAALTRRYVEADCAQAYGQPVTYAADAFAGLRFMEDLAARKAAGTLRPRAPEPAQEHVACCAPAPTTRPTVAVQPSPVPAAPAAAPPPGLRPLPEGPPLSVGPLAVAPVPAAPFLGTRLLEGVTVEELMPWVNRRTLFRFQWGFRQRKLSDEAYAIQQREVMEPALDALVARVQAEGILQPRAVYGYFPAYAEDTELVVLDPAGHSELGRFSFPRQTRAPHRAISDYFRDAKEQPDLLGLTAVTMGSRASEVARQWFAEGRYQEYLFLHGLSVEVAEAFAEHLHAKMRAELRIHGSDSPDMERIFQKGYQGCRYSFGYPACPDLEQNRLVLDLLDAGRIGLVMDPDGQMHPEQSTAAVVVHHPEARYYAVK
ncbi:MAG: methionine synthase [Deltaproteobacteria bacterium]|nr:methionine synthase [Deltaproteobacteria bacterium]